MFASLFRVIKLTLIILLLLIVVVFTVSNRGDVVLSLYPLPYEIALPTYLFFLLTLTVGYMVGTFFGSMHSFRHKRIAKKEHQKVEALQEEVAALRARENTAPAYKKGPNINPSNPVLLPDSL